MKDILIWLQAQPGGTATYTALVRKLEDALKFGHGDAAIVRMLALLTNRFVDAFERDPLPAPVNQQALEQLTLWVDRAVRLEGEGPAEKLDFLNDVARADLGSSARG